MSLEIWAWSVGSTILISLMSLIGILTLFSRKLFADNLLQFMISFAAGTLIGDAFFHLMPEAVEGSGGFALSVSLGVIAGILLFFLLEKFIHWRHCHIPTSDRHPHPVATMNLIGDGIHNFLDGVVVAASFIVSIPLGIATTFAVVLHEIPQEVSDFGILLHAGYSRKRALMMNLLFALTSVAGAIATLWIGTLSETLANFLLPVTAGGFIYIAGVDLIPDIHKEVKPWRSAVQFGAILLGLAIMWLLL